jgi:uncharacterized protein (TIGR01777 family)
MNILIAGASGFIGSELVKALARHHNVTVLGRDINTLQKKFPQQINKITWNTLSQLNATNFEAVINLCGYNIAQSRWTAPIKKMLIDSRVNTNKKLISWLITQSAKPHFICANAVGIYGLQNNENPPPLDENSIIDLEHPKDFLSEIGIAWQNSLLPAIDYGIRVTTTRFGVALKKGAGMLKKLELSFYLGLGSVLGGGKQVISWVHIEDIIESMLFLLKHPELTGAFNITSPNPVSQREFARTLARTMKRPLFFNMPALIIKALLGEMGECLLLKGQRVIPTRLIELGYQFKYPTLAKALKKEYE